MTANAVRCPENLKVDDLRIGELLAEGGEGRVFELPLQPHLVYKAYRRPVAADSLRDLVAWPSGIDSALQTRIGAAAAWPAGVVWRDAETACGLLLPRAPRRFALRHKDGTTRLASLSYLTADPAHRAVAYGLDLPEEGSPDRLGLVLALARLLEAFESGRTLVGHGDLSAKNVLWSLQRGPEVFVIDCDNSEQYTPAGASCGRALRRRAMTPNWEDPSVPPGANPTLASDRYSLALIFLRVVGAANFPLQARQRDETCVSVEISLPRPLLSTPALGPAAPVWQLCRRGLSVRSPDQRPSPSEWVYELERILDHLGSGSVALAVRANQGGGEPVGRPSQAMSTLPLDVEIRPVPREAPRPEPRLTRIPVRTGAGGGFQALGARPKAPAPPISMPPPNPVLPRILDGISQAVRLWWSAHRRAAGLLTGGSRRADGLVWIGICGFVDLLILIVGFFVTAMVVAPISGI